MSFILGRKSALQRRKSSNKSLDVDEIVVNTSAEHLLRTDIAAKEIEAVITRAHKQRQNDYKSLTKYVRVIG
jgi:hypothetical protein